MGRPLKIAKSQAVVTLTDTAVTGSLVTTSANFTTLGIKAGMPFIVASTVGGLTTATVYYILSVVNSGSNSTFTASATPLNANPDSTPVTLTNTTGQTVAVTIGATNSAFNNPTGGTGYPATNANTYSVVGGLTTQFGKQVVANVMLSQTGNGTVYSTTTSNVIGSYSNIGAVPNLSAIMYVDSSGVTQNLGYVANAIGNITVAITDATAAGNFLTTSGNAQTLTANLPVKLTANIGGLTTTENYFVKAIPNATAFTVSLAAGGSNVVLSDETAASNATQSVSVLAANASANLSANAFTFGTPEAGYLVRQKGKQKYLVTGTSTGLSGQCYTANVANTALIPGQMTITATFANAATIKVQSLSDHTAELFSATSGPVATGNIVLQNATPAFATFNSAVAANATAGYPYPIVQIGNT